MIDTCHVLKPSSCTVHPALLASTLRSDSLAAIFDVIEQPPSAGLYC